MDKRIVDKCNRKTPNFAYGNFSFQEKEFNMGLEENSNEFSQISANAETSPNPYIKRNLI